MYGYLFAFLLWFLSTFFVIAIALMIFSIIVYWKLFEKAGKEGWKSIIPIYNTIVLLDIIGYKWYYIFMFLLSLIPIIGPILLLLFMISYNIKLAKAFGQSTIFGIGLWLLSPVFAAIIAFSKDINYVGKTVDKDIDFNDLF